MRKSGLRQSDGEALRLHTALSNSIGIKIVSGEYKPGDTLANEMAVRDDLKVSRSVYREAMRTLSAKGLVWTRTRIGTRVTPPHRWNLLDPQVLDWMMQGQPPRLVVERLVEMRRILEPIAASLAASRRTRQDLIHLRETLFDLERETPDGVTGREADYRFHDAILRASGNPFIASFSSAMRAAITLSTSTPRTQGRPLLEHRKVFEAISHANADAAYRTTHQLLDCTSAITTKSTRRSVLKTHGLLTACALRPQRRKSPSQRSRD